MKDYRQKFKSWQITELSKNIVARNLVGASLCPTNGAANNCKLKSITEAISRVVKARRLYQLIIKMLEQCIDVIAEKQHNEVINTVIANQQHLLMMQSVDNQQAELKPLS